MWLPLLSVQRQWFCCCWFIVGLCSHGDCVIGLCLKWSKYCFFLVLRSYHWGRDTWLLYLNKLCCCFVAVDVCFLFITVLFVSVCFVIVDSCPYSLAFWLNTLWLFRFAFIALRMSKLVPLLIWFFHVHSYYLFTLTIFCCVKALSMVRNSTDENT